MSVPLYVCTPADDGCNCWTAKSCMNGQQCHAGKPDCVTAVDWVITSVTEIDASLFTRFFEVCYKDQGSPGNQDKFGLGLLLCGEEAKSAGWPYVPSGLFPDEPGVPDSAGATKCVEFSVNVMGDEYPYVAFTIDCTNEWAETDEDNNSYYVEL